MAKRILADAVLDRVSLKEIPHRRGTLFFHQFAVGLAWPVVSRGRRATVPLPPAFGDTSFFHEQMRLAATDFRVNGT